MSQGYLGPRCRSWLYGLVMMSAPLAACGGSTSPLNEPTSGQPTTETSMDPSGSHLPEQDPLGAYRPSERRYGVNLAGAEFGKLPGEFSTDYIYPHPKYAQGYQSARYFADKGMNIFRLPFRWMRLQPTRGAAFDTHELERLSTTVSGLRSLGVVVLLDAHDYARYAAEQVIGSPEVPNTDFADFWRRLADEFKHDANVWFGLMNEPHDIDARQWLAAANEAIAAIRATGAKNYILVPGVNWTGAHSWTSGEQGSNAVVMLGVVDPLNNYGFEVHQYLDGDSSGTDSTCVHERIGVDRLRGFTEWARQHGFKALLGEFDGGPNEVCEAAVKNMLEHMDGAREVYLGWTWWAAGPWWGSHHERVLEPNPDGTDKPQMAWLAPYLARD